MKRAFALVQGSAAERAYGDIELERPLESLCPGQLCGFGRFWLACPVLKIRGGGLRGVFFAGFARLVCHLGAR